MPLVPCVFSIIMSNKFESFAPNSGLEACITLENELEKILTKLGGIKSHAGRVFNDLINHVKNLESELSNAPEDHVLTNLQATIVMDAMEKVTETLCRLATEHRELHGNLSKFGKLIDRVLIPDYAATSKPNIFNTPDNINLINRVICQHYQRQGMHDVAEALATETDIKYEFNEKESFKTLNHILDCLQNKDMEPALVWATSNATALDEMNSAIEFKLHRLRYIQLLCKGVNHQSEAISYARNHFQKFVKKHERDIQILMGMLLYIPNGIETSPYSYMVNEEELWIDIYELFTKDACQLLGITVNSPLAICMNAGCAAIPALLNIKQVMSQRQVSGIWSGKDELPIEIDLGQDSRYHSMFACPILRQQSTKNNPPMKLVCGHVISRDALNKLCNGNKLKCPYCPVEQSPNDARLVIF